MKFKIILAALIVSLSATTITGCSKNENLTSNTETTQSGSTTESGDTASSGSSSSNKQKDIEKLKSINDTHPIESKYQLMTYPYESGEYTVQELSDMVDSLGIDFTTNACNRIEALKEEGTTSADAIGEYLYSICGFTEAETKAAMKKSGVSDSWAPTSDPYTPVWDAGNTSMPSDTSSSSSSSSPSVIVGSNEVSYADTSAYLANIKAGMTRTATGFWFVQDQDDFMMVFNLEERTPMTLDISIIRKDGAIIPEDSFEQNGIVFNNKRNGVYSAKDVPVSVITDSADIDYESLVITMLMSCNITNSDQLAYDSIRDIPEGWYCSPSGVITEPSGSDSSATSSTTPSITGSVTLSSHAGTVADPIPLGEWAKVKYNCFVGSDKQLLDCYVRIKQVIRDSEAEALVEKYNSEATITVGPVQDGLSRAVYDIDVYFPSEWSVGYYSDTLQYFSSPNIPSCFKLKGMDGSDVVGDYRVWGSSTGIDKSYGNLKAVVDTIYETKVAGVYVPGADNLVMYEYTSAKDYNVYFAVK